MTDDSTATDSRRRAGLTDSATSDGAGLAATVPARLAEAVRLRDPDLAEHGRRAANVAAAIAAEMGLSTEETDRVHLAALLHDIGKIGVAEAILWKPAGLTPTEWGQIRTHPEKGHRLVADVVPADVATAVLSHHERIDGAGYPHGVDAGVLPLTVRIVQVADAYDAITSDRPYQVALSTRVAIAEIRRCAGTQFDPDVADALESLLGPALDGEAVVDLTSPAVVLRVDPYPAGA